MVTFSFDFSVDFLSISFPSIFSVDFLSVSFLAKRFFKKFSGYFTKEEKSDGDQDESIAGIETDEKRRKRDRRLKLNDKVYARQKLLMDSIESSISSYLLDPSLTNFIKSRVFIPLPQHVRSALKTYLQVSQFVSCAYSI